MGSIRLNVGRKNNSDHELPLWYIQGVYSVRYVKGEKMRSTTQWLVTLKFRMTVNGVQSKDDSVAEGLEQLRQMLSSGEDVPVEANVRRITNAALDEPIFGVRW